MYKIQKPEIKTNILIRFQEKSLPLKLRDSLLHWLQWVLSQPSWSLSGVQSKSQVCSVVQDETTTHFFFSLPLLKVVWYRHFTFVLLIKGILSGKKRGRGVRTDFEETIDRTREPYKVYILCVCPFSWSVGGCRRRV